MNANGGRRSSSERRRPSCIERAVRYAGAMLEVRLLSPGDEARTDAFLARHEATSMFLRSNLRAAGLADEGQPLQATWAAALAGERIVAVAAHAWNGMVLVQAPEALGVVVRAATAATRARGRSVAGITGPHAQVIAARDALGLGERRAAMDSRERLYALDLGALRMPPALEAGRVRARPAEERDLATCAAWREDYSVENLGLPRADAARRARPDIEHTIARGDAFVLEEDGALVAFSAFNARLPEVVQIGGVWTPVALRGRGRGRAVVAGSLQIAAREGVRRAVLFTGDDNVAAKRAYEALGFVAGGDYGLLLFAP